MSKHRKKYVVEDLNVGSMNAEKLIEQLNLFAERNGVELSQVDVASNAYAHDDSGMYTWIELETWV
jgi:hypothetical protein